MTEPPGEQTLEQQPPAAEPDSEPPVRVAIPRPAPLPRGVKRRVGARSLALLALPTAVLGLLISLGGLQGSVAVGAIVGHAVGQGVTLSWLVGAVLTYDSPTSTFMLTTLGLWPLRFVLVVFCLGAALAAFELSAVGLALGFILTHLYGTVIEGFAFAALTNAGKKQGQASG